MSRTMIPLTVGDVSAFARSLGGQLARLEGTPGHLELLNMLARSAGCRNFQHLRARQLDQDALDRATPAPAPSQADPQLVRRVLRYFDAQGRLIRWPGKFSHRLPCLWVLWSRLPARQTLNEPQVREVLERWHLFGDHALLRRELCDNALVERTPDCREYRRRERRPTAEALALIERLNRRAE